MENNQKFSYTYSADKQEEIKNIRKKYLPKDSSDPVSKLEQLRKLDHSVTRKGSVIALILGIIGTLILGVGMCCCMVWHYPPFNYIVGIVVGILGIALLSSAYPIYKKITEKERTRLTPEILRLSNELLGQ